MRKLNYIFMITAMVCGIAGMVLAIYQHQNWSWQFGTAMWAFIAYINEKNTARMEGEMKELADQMKDILKNKK